MDNRTEVIMPIDEACAMSSYFPIIRLRSEMIIEEGGLGEPISVLRPDLGRTYRMAATGARIWELIREPLTAGEVVNALLNEYDIDRITCEAEVFRFLAMLSKERLIQFGLCC